ncbi:DNA-directed RNA polymerase III subunit rpc5 [Hyphodiscus hymeniophilus]|uniref:DNA-directed RNA polymerase III subunit rpc5 n=1 Tax=Hyphodiscus hymeniophilus TaxID=353542 RepID=A0A9P6VQE7_9HELO|nr:DNA-directed RNA polymerase III subunit rpc5 [Hyphodiscus hymeniophilus]
MADAEAKRAAKKDELDPIVAEFPIFIKPALDSDRQIMILQFPNRERNKPYDVRNNSAPLELRVKPNAGMVELDVPMDVHRNFDRIKGVKWGEAMKKSSMAKGGGSHGLPGGFGIGGAPQAGRGRGRGEAEEAENQEKLLENYDKAIEDGHVLATQTLGGQFVAKNSTSPIYMVGTFTNGQLHLTPVDQIVPLRPQFHHIDAATEQDRLSRARDAGPPRVTEARAVHMTVKSPGEGEDDHGDNMNKRVQEVQAEPWRAHRFVDAETEESWSFFQENFFAGGAMGQNTEELLAKVPKLISGVNDEQYLDMISAPIDKNRLKKARDAEKVARREERKARLAQKENDKGKGKEVASGEDDGYSSDTLSEPDGAEAEAKARDAGDDEVAAA